MNPKEQIEKNRIELKKLNAQRNAYKNVYLKLDQEHKALLAHTMALHKFMKEEMQ